MLGMAAVPPLLVLCLDELLVRQRWRWWVTGLAIGGLAFVQFFLGTELLVLTVIAGGHRRAGAGGRRRRVPPRRVWSPGCPTPCGRRATAAVSSAVLLAWPAWFALAGPAHLSGNIWGSPLPQLRRHNLRLLRAPDGGLGQGHRADPPGRRLPGPVAVGAVPRDRPAGRPRRRACSSGTATCACGCSPPSAWSARCFSVGLAFHRWTLWRLLVRAPLMEQRDPQPVRPVRLPVRRGHARDRRRPCLAVRRRSAAALDRTHGHRLVRRPGGRRRRAGARRSRTSPTDCR